MSVNESGSDQVAGVTDLSRVEDILVCPKCTGQVSIATDAVCCSICNAQFPVRDGVPFLALEGSSDTWENAEAPQATSEAYQQEYQDVAEAAEYNAAYKQKLFKRLSTAREYRILQRLLQSQGHAATLLDLPCGGGRLSPQLALFADLIVEADIGAGQVLYGKQNCQLSTPQVWMTASAFHIPFKADSFDGVVCCRLCHHLPTAAERERLMQELFRVAKRFVIMTFFDFYSVKNTLRRIRRPFDHQPPKMTMTIAEVREQAQKSGFSLIAYPTLASLSSGHRYALMVKDA